MHCLVVSPLARPRAASLLATRGHTVRVWSTREWETQSVAGRDGCDLLVIDDPHHAAQLLTRIRIRAPYNPPPHTVWTWTPNSPNRRRVEVSHVTFGDVTGRCGTWTSATGGPAAFRLWLDRLETRRGDSVGTRLVFLHAHRACRVGPQITYRDWISRSRCLPDEQVIDVLLPDGSSLLEAGHTGTEPLLRSDLPWLDHMARYSAWEERCTIEELILNLVHSAHGPGVSASMRATEVSTAFARNVITRLRAALRSGGLDATDVLRCEDDEYYLNVQTDVMHVPAS